MNDPLLRWREHFPILASTAYLISNSLGAMPRQVREGLGDYAEAWATRGVLAWEDAGGGQGWWDMPARIGNLIAPLIGAEAGQVSVQPNVTLATAMALSCFDFRAPRNRVVLNELEFPSVLYQYQALRDLGAEIVMVPSGDGVRVPAERIIAAIDERTAVVQLSHVLFRSAWIQDVAAVIRAAHQAGAGVVLDTYHSAGVLPFSVRELEVDFAVGGVLKWLCGGPGVAFLYVKPELVPRLRPRLAGWQAHRRPFAFEPEMDPRDDAWRFLTGTPAIPALYAARPGLEIINEVGVENIRGKSVRQTGLLIERARQHGWRVNSPLEASERGGTVTIDVPGAERVCRELLVRRFLVDHRPGAGIRIAPHFYTADDEIEAVVEEMHRII